MTDGLAERARVLARVSWLRRALLVFIAAVGASLLLVVAVDAWRGPGDEYAYWLAGHRLLAGDPIYDPSANSVTPSAFWYPPIVAQVVSPLTAVVSQPVFSIGWIVLLIGCLWWLADRNVLVALALCAFPPVAIELWWRNVHLILAVTIVLAIRQWAGWFAIGAAIKLAPVVGIAFLVLTSRWRQAATALLIGAVALGISILISPEAWRQFIEVIAARGTSDASSFLPVSYFGRLITSIVIIVLGSRLPRRWGELFLVVGVVVALPTLWFNALSTLVAAVPLIRRPTAATRAA